MSALSPLQTLWLDALVDSKRVLKPEQIKDLWYFTTILESYHLSRVYKKLGTDSAVIIKIVPVQSLPAIESREVLLFLIASLVTERQQTKWFASSRKELEEYTYPLGCLADDCDNIAERWRKLACTRSIDELPYAGLENRPRCKICGGIVATGAGWQPEASGLDPAVYGPYRTDLHHECKNYALTVLLPRHRAQQLEAARKAAGETDK